MTWGLDAAAALDVLDCYCTDDFFLNISIRLFLQEKENSR